MQKANFYEVQHFRHWDLLLVLSLLIVGLGYRVSYPFFVGEDIPGSSLYLGLLLLLALSLFLFGLLSLKLEIKVTEKGIRYRYFPLHMHKRRIDWSEIASWRLEHYPVSSTLSGHRIHFSLADEDVYDLQGAHLLRLCLRDGREVQLSIKHPQEVTPWLQQYGAELDKTGTEDCGC